MTSEQRAATADRAIKWLRLAATPEGAPEACAPRLLRWLMRKGWVEVREGAPETFFATASGRWRLAEIEREQSA